MSVIENQSSLSHLLLLHFTTGDQDQLHSDKSALDISLMTFMIFDMEKNIFEDPQCIDISSHSTVSCPTTSLEEALDILDSFITSKKLRPEEFCLCTDGPSHLRQVLFPEIMRKNITLRSYMFQYIDIQIMFKNYIEKDQKVSKENVNMADMLSFFGYNPCNYCPESDACYIKNAAFVLQQIMGGRPNILASETIKSNFTQSLCHYRYIDDNLVVKVRGLPWEATEEDVYKFFYGLDVADGGIALCLRRGGAKNGYALINFEKKQHQQLAIARNNQYVGIRYIEVFPASGKEFLEIACVDKHFKAKVFLQRGEGTYHIIRMVGLPYNATGEQIKAFFADSEPSVTMLSGDNNDILFVKYGDGCPTGDAFVMFPNKEMLKLAMSKNKQNIGGRYISLHISTPAEVLQILRSRQKEIKGFAVNIPHLQSNKLKTSRRITQLNQSSGKKNCVVLQGLPYDTVVNDVLRFLGKNLCRAILPRGVHMVVTSHGIPTGDAAIQMDSENVAFTTAKKKNMQMIMVNNRNSYVKASQCSKNELEDIIQKFVLLPINNTNSFMGAEGMAQGFQPVFAATCEPGETNILNQGSLQLLTASSPPNTFVIDNHICNTNLSPIQCANPDCLAPYTFFDQSQEWSSISQPFAAAALPSSIFQQSADESFPRTAGQQCLPISQNNDAFGFECTPEISYSLHFSPDENMEACNSMQPIPVIINETLYQGP